MLNLQQASKPPEPSVCQKLSLTYPPHLLMQCSSVTYWNESPTNPLNVVLHSFFNSSSADLTDLMLTCAFSPTFGRRVLSGASSSSMKKLASGSLGWENSASGATS
eukprot:6211997-Pleurochrysis_carterae.AAC.3